MNILQKELQTVRVARGLREFACVRLARGFAWARLARGLRESPCVRGARGVRELQLLDKQLLDMQLFM